MNRISRAKQLLLLRCFACGCGIRDCVEIAECDAETVLRYLALFGAALSAFHEKTVVSLSTERLEIDEAWGFVGGKSRNRKQFRPSTPKWFGDYFTWIALDPDTKLLVAWHVSKRTLKEAIAFLGKVRNAVSGKVMITTDSLSLYRRAIKVVFGEDAEHVRIEKVLETRGDRETGDYHTALVKMTKHTRRGSKADLDLASTSHNERHNGTLRGFISRLARRTHSFSKKIENHVHAHAIYSAYYNFRKPHRSLGHETPAMRAGITDHVWSFDQLFEVIEAHTSAELTTRDATSVDPFQFQPLPAGVPQPDATFFVWREALRNTTKVHAGHCSACRFGIGKKGGSATTEWYAFYERATAEAAAAQLSPDRHSICRICLGHYRTRSRSG